MNVSFNNIIHCLYSSIQVKKCLDIDIHSGFTLKTLLGTLFCGTALDKIASFLSLLLCIDIHATHLGFGHR
jgi:hypothetical protein